MRLSSLALPWMAIFARKCDCHAMAGLEKSFLCQSQNCLGCHFSGRIFFHLGRSRAPRLESLGAKKKKEPIFEAIFCTHPDTNIINEMVASSFYWRWKSMKSKKKKKNERKEKERKKERKRNYWKEHTGQADGSKYPVSIAKTLFTGKKLGPLHSHETLRGRGWSCWLKADKKFASRAKRKKKEKKKKWKMRLHV